MDSYYALNYCNLRYIFTVFHRKKSDILLVSFPLRLEARLNTLFYILTFSILCSAPMLLQAKVKLILEEQTVRGRLQKPQVFYSISRYEVNKKKQHRGKKVSLINRTLKSAKDL